MSNKKVTKTVGRVSIWHGGQKLTEGDEVEVTAEQAEKLDFTPKKEVVTKTVEVEKQIPAELTDEQRIRLIVGYWPSFKEEDFTKSGTPKVKVVEELIGFDVTAEQIEAAFNLLVDFEPLFVSEET